MDLTREEENEEVLPSRNAGVTVAAPYGEVEALLRRCGLREVPPVRVTGK